MARYRAPGRVNLIGDHTDYNAGFVLPMAIQLETVVTRTPREAPELLIVSERHGDPVHIDLGKPLQPRHDWTDYVVGVASVLLEEGYTVTGADLHISSTVPQGAGLSSSAALETASALALLDGRIPDRVTMARWCQRAENGFVGARCGIMDQYVACLGQAGHALMIDCRSLVSRAVPVPPQATVVVANTMVKHSIAGPEYAERRRQCEEIVNVLTAVLPHILSLRDVTLSDLETHGHLLSSRARKRARHVISENARVLEAAHALECGHLDRLGELMCDSHGSLRDDFEVSSPELDLMVTLALAQPGVFGSRMTGGGFGGSTVTLVAASAASMLMDALRTGYERETGTTPDVRVCTPSAGASDVMGEHARA